MSLCRKRNVIVFKCRLSEIYGIATDCLLRNVNNELFVDKDIMPKGIVWRPHTIKKFGPIENSTSEKDR